MDRRVDCWIDEHRQEIIETLRTVLRYRSVYDQNTITEETPFGHGVSDCLEKTLEIAAALGFSTKNLDGYAGIADRGDGKETLGILGHLDVVPEGDGWSHDPYGGEIADGKIFGRGTLDDKGPMIAAMYAVRAVSEYYSFRRKIRMIFGCNEETGMKCLEYYRLHEAEPDLSFSPDARFPLTCSEKSMMTAVFRRSYGSTVELRAGTAHNTIPGEAFAEVPLPEETVRNACDLFSEETRFGFELKTKGGRTEIRCIGCQAHAANPEDGKNALQALINLLARLPLPAEDLKALCGLRDLFRMEYYGEGLGLDVSDASGRLTINLGIIDWNEGGYELTLDLRVPIECITEKEAAEKLLNSMKAAGAELKSYEFDQGYSIPEDSELVQAVLEVFRTRTGLVNAKADHIGGGTYARKLRNAVSFGPERYFCESSDHSIDEFIGVEQLVFLTKIYADAVIRLCCETTVD